MAGDSRTWVAIEQREISIPANATYRFRFEITPPKDTKPRECRFAIMLSENDTSLVKLKNGFNIPISGQIAEIVYVSVGDVKPKLKIVKSYAKYINKSPNLFLTISNSGNAHGRLDGFLQGTDANGTKFDISPSTLPILPGERREVSLDINEGKNIKLSNIRLPIVVKGKLEIGEESVAFNQTFSN